MRPVVAIAGEKCASRPQLETRQGPICEKHSEKLLLEDVLSTDCEEDKSRTMEAPIETVAI
jgi:uncharacterized protein YqkB